MKLNERALWTKELNLLWSAKFLAHMHTGEQGSFFIGPVFNVLVSKVKNAETNEIGSVMVPYSFVTLNDSTKERKINQWVGVYAGFRF